VTLTLADANRVIAGAIEKANTNLTHLTRWPVTARRRTIGPVFYRYSASEGAIILPRITTAFWPTNHSVGRLPQAG